MVVTIWTPTSSYHSAPKSVFFPTKYLSKNDLLLYSTKLAPMKNGRSMVSINRQMKRVKDTSMASLVLRWKPTMEKTGLVINGNKKL